MTAATTNGKRIKPDKNPPTREEAIFGIKPEEALHRLRRLTPREKQVAEMMATGKKNMVIAAEMGISKKTLDIHRAKIAMKAETSGQADTLRIIFASKFAAEPAAQPMPAASQVTPAFDMEEFEARR